MKTRKLLFACLITAGLFLISGMTQTISAQKNNPVSQSVNDVVGGGEKIEMGIFNFPDPFVNATYIYLDIPWPGVYTLTVFEPSTGKLEILLEGVMYPGTHKLLFAPDGDKATVYHTTLRTLQNEVRDEMVKEGKQDEGKPNL